MFLLYVFTSGLREKPSFSDIDIVLEASAGIRKI